MNCLGHVLIDLLLLVDMYQRQQVMVSFSFRL